MAKVDFEYPYGSVRGKISKKKDLVFVQNTQTGQHFSRYWTGRDFEAHPVTAREAQTQARMKEAVAAYHALKNDPVAYGEFMNLYNQTFLSSSQPQEGASPKSKPQKRPNPYNFFISRYLDEGKHSDMLRIAHSSTSVESYVEAVRSCPDQASAARVIIDFLRTIGFSSLADAYANTLTNPGI